VGGETVTAYNVVRMRVKPGRNNDYVEAHRSVDRDSFAGMRSFTIVQTGERDYCVIGEWDSMDALAGARPKMIETLDSFRDMLDDLGGDLGVTDPVSGEAVFEVHREMT
jgi:heme-degrading monooxygenase HmoA